MPATTSYQQSGPVYWQFFQHDYDSYARHLGLIAVNSSNTAVPRIEDFVQRSGENIGDLSGKIYNSAGSTPTLVEVEYSQVSIDGPWLSTTVLSDDSSYNFPAGTTAGQDFNIPVEIDDVFTGDIWMRIEITYA